MRFPPARRLPPRFFPPALRFLFTAPFLAAARRLLRVADFLRAAALAAAFRLRVLAAFCAAALRLALEIAIDDLRVYCVLCSTSHEILLS